MKPVIIELHPEGYNELELFRLERETASDAVFRLLSLHGQMRGFLKLLLGGEREEQKDKPRMAQKTYTLEELTEIINAHQSVLTHHQEFFHDMPEHPYSLGELTDIVNRYEKLFDGIIRIMENSAVSLSVDHAERDRKVIKGIKECAEKLGKCR